MDKRINIMLNPKEASRLEKLLVDVNDIRKERGLEKMYKPYMLARVYTLALDKGITAEEIADV